MSPELRRSAESFNLLNPQAARLGFGGNSMMSLKLRKFKLLAPSNAIYGSGIANSAGHAKLMSVKSDLSQQLDTDKMNELGDWRNPRSSCIHP